MATQAIWKDRFVTLGNTSPLEYRVRVGDDAIYNGKSYIRPDATDNTIKINDICADYLLNVLPLLDDTTFAELGTISFITEVQSGVNWVEKDSIEFINDWSYDYDYDLETMGMAFPISTRVDARQMIPFSSYGKDSLTAKVTLRDGSSFNQYIATHITPDFNNDYNEDFARSLRGTGNGTAMIDISQWDCVSVEVEGILYEVVGTCNRYALYYLNAYGGWDSLLIEGTHKSGDTIKRYTREMEYDNRSSANRAKDNYLNEMERNYSFNTGWLSDEESLRMHHLLSSTNVYMMDLETGKVYPLVITTTECEHKTFKSNGRQMVSYTIDATLSQSMIRR